MQKLIENLLRVVGVVLVGVGLLGAYYGPLEIYVFYFFSPGGQFHYEGFGIGSLWFAYLVVQNIGYYIVAALCLPLGYGHFRLRRWALTLTRLFLWLWMGAGVILVENLALLASTAFLTPDALNPDLPGGVLYGRFVLVGVGAVFSCIMLPLLGLWFYRSDRVRKIFETHDPNQYWIDRFPAPVLGIVLLLGVLILVLHIAIFLQAVFPLFGQLLLGRQMVYVISGCILLLGVLMFGAIRLKNWAWWGLAAALGLLTVSSLMTFSKVSIGEIIRMMDLPPYERAFLSELQLLQNLYLVGLVSAPLLALTGLVIASKKYFGK